MSLQDWENNGWLKSHQPVAGDIERILSIVRRDLHQSKSENLNNDWRFNIAYSAILNIGSAALAACGYRAARGAHHYWVIQSMRLTLCTDSEIVDELDSYRAKRNLSIYTESGIISDVEAKEVVQLAEQLWNDLIAWLKENHSNLLEE